MKFAKTSLPTPLSPISIILTSVIAAFVAIFNAFFKATEVTINSLFISFFLFVFTVGIFSFNFSTLFIV